MHILDNKRICGHANGPRYRNAILPKFYDSDGTEFGCPDGYLPCIEGSKNSFCYPKTESAESACPITDVKFLRLDDTPEISKLTDEGYQ